MIKTNFTKTHALIILIGLSGGFLYPVVMDESGSYFGDFSKGFIILGLIVLIIIFTFLLIKEINQESKVDNDIYNFKSFFKEDHYNKFLKISEEVGIYNPNNKWVYQENESTYLAVFYHKLKNNNYLKITNKEFSVISKSTFGIELTNTTISHYKKDTDKFDFGGYKEFYEEVLAPFGDK